MAVTMTAREQQVVEKVKTILPESWKQFGELGLTSDDVDKRILAYAELVLGDINIWPPQTEFTVNDMPAVWIPIVVLGADIFAKLFAMQKWSLLDFDYNDNGLSLPINRTQRIDTSYKNMVEIYGRQIKYAKKNWVLKVRGRGLGTPRYTSQLGQFLRIALGSAWPTF